MFAAMTRAAERWRAVKIADFDRRRLAAVRVDLDQGYEAQIGLPKPTSNEKTPRQIIQQLSDLTIDRRGLSRLPYDNTLIWKGGYSWQAGYEALLMVCSLQEPRATVEIRIRTASAGPK